MRRVDFRHQGVAPPPPGALARPATRALRRRACGLLLTVTVLGIAALVAGFPSGTTARAAGLPRTGGPSASGNAVCASTGPVYLGVEWNCVAILNLVELLLMVAAILIVAYIFWDSDAAERPGEATTVPLTEAEWASARDARVQRRRDAVRDADAGEEA